MDSIIALDRLIIALDKLGIEFSMNHWPPHPLVRPVIEMRARHTVWSCNHEDCPTWGTEPANETTINIIKRGAQFIINREKEIGNHG